MIQRFFYVLLSLCWLSCAEAATSIDRLTQLLNQYTTYSADFKQLTLGTNDQIVQQSYGHVMIQRPGKFRWVVTDPLKEVLIVNGNTLWHYDVALMQATKTTVNDQGNAANPVSLLTAPVGDLMRNYTVFLVGLYGKAWYELIPRSPNAGFKKIYFYFEQGQLTQLIVVNNLNERSLFQFSGIQLNQPISTHAFIFTPPKGVDVVGA